MQNVPEINIFIVIYSLITTITIKVHSAHIKTVFLCCSIAAGLIHVKARNRLEIWSVEKLMKVYRYHACLEKPSIFGDSPEAENLKLVADSSIQDEQWSAAQAIALVLIQWAKCKLIMGLFYLWNKNKRIHMYYLHDNVLAKVGCSILSRVQSNLQSSDTDFGWKIIYMRHIVTSEWSFNCGNVSQWHYTKFNICLNWVP